MNFSSILRAAALSLAVALFGGVAHAQQEAKPDSVQPTAAISTPSNCPNITTQWYAAGQVPAGHYKSNGDGNCYPIPACNGGMVWNGGSQACACPAGQSWDAAWSQCHAPCPGGTSWNGSSCANICPAGTSWNGSACASICAAGTSWNGSACTSVCSGGQVWNGSACACPAGQSWNGSSCGVAPTINSFTVAPPSVEVGSNYTASWSIGGGTSATLNCAGATNTSFGLAPVASGSGTFAAAAPGNTTCQITATNSYGSTTSSSVSVTAACPSGSSWNGTSCGNVCTGGATWNGSACVCPAGQAWNGSSCGNAPSVTAFSMTPAAAVLGVNTYTVSWTATGGATSAVLNCSGANSGAHALSPASGGTGTKTPVNPGNSTCHVTATNSYGSANSSAITVSAACPAGQSWNGTACAVTPCPAGQTWNGSTCGLAPTFSGLTLTPANGVIGNNFTVTWSSANASSGTISCTGAHTRSIVMTPTASGSATFAITAPGTTTCTGSVSGSHGNANSPSTSAVSACQSNMVWNGSACACPSGESWNGGSCGSAPTVTAFSITPATATLGVHNYSVSWATSNATSAVLNCTGANPSTNSLTPVNSGAGTKTPVSGGNTTCQVVATNSYGSVTSSSITVSAVCPAGQTWNGTACVSVCPAGQSWNGSSCGTAPTFPTLTLTPANGVIGNNFTVTWSTTNASTGNISCTGAHIRSIVMAPTSSGSATFPITAPGTTTCTGEVSGSHGNANSPSTSSSSACPAGMTWNGSNCQLASQPFDPISYSRNFALRDQWWCGANRVCGGDWWGLWDDAYLSSQMWSIQPLPAEFNGWTAQGPTTGTPMDHYWITSGTFPKTEDGAHMTVGPSWCSVAKSGSNQTSVQVRRNSDGLLKTQYHTVYWWCTPHGGDDFTFATTETHEIK